MNTTLPFAEYPIMEQSYARLYELIVAPSQNLEMIWIMVPLILTALVMEVYFGWYYKEELGWNTAVGNSLVLIFISIDLLKYVFYSLYPGGVMNLVVHYPVKTIIAVLVAFSGSFLFLADSLHMLPKRIAFFISKPSTVNTWAYVAVAMVYSNVPFDRVTFFAMLILFVVLQVMFLILHIFQGILKKILSGIWNFLTSPFK